MLTKKTAYLAVISFNGAGNGARTRDIQLGRLTLYQLSYSRNAKYIIPQLLFLVKGLMVGVQGFEPWAFCSQSRRATKLRYTPLF